MSNKEKLVIMDGNSIASRAFYALPLLSSASGMHTNAVYGFTTILLKVLEEYKPSHLLVAFDAGKVVFRHQEYQEYKGQRQKTPGELSEQYPLIKELLDAFSIRHLDLPGYEADDIIGTLTRQADEYNIPTLVVSGDKDMLQLVSDHVHIALTRKGISETEIYDKQAVNEKYGLTPQQIIDLKGLMGDSSDNIPGVPGVGEKTALKLLHEFGSVEAVLENTDKIKGKLRENIIANRDLAKLSKELATILRDAPVEIGMDDLVYAGYEPERVIGIYKKLEFKSLLERMDGGQADGKSVMAQPAEELQFVVAEKENISALTAKLTSPMAVYVEVDGEYYHNAPIPGLALSDGESNFYAPFSLLTEWPELLAWLADPAQVKWTHDAKRIKGALAWKGVAFDGAVMDTYIASYLLNPSESSHNLSDITKRKSDFVLPSDDEVYGKGAKRQLPEGSVLAEHVCRKAAAIVSIVTRLERELQENELSSLFAELELPLGSILSGMEFDGFKVDKERLQDMGKEINGQLDVLTREIYQLAGKEFNINSTKQLGEILFEKLNLPPLKKTKTGYSTGADVLEKLIDHHEIIPKLLHYRQLGKLQSTYIEGLLKEINPKTGKIHTIFNQAITATGRLSSTEPNLQNIPIRLEEGRKIREAFIPSESDWVILSADYSQIELRVLAHISGDHNLIEAFRHGSDIHTETAVKVFGVSADQVTSLMRRQAKAVNFGIVYGISDYGLSQNLGITRKEAAEFIEKYFAVYQGVRQYMKEIVKKAKQEGYVTTLLNRRRYLPEINSSNFNLRSFAERTAMNTPIQGTAADIIKLAMANVAARMKRETVMSRMLLQVHDELVFEVPEKELPQLRKLVTEEMENAISLDVPLKVDVSSGKTWYDAK